MSGSQHPHLPSADRALFSSSERLPQKTDQPTAVERDVAHLLADDPAMLIGLALAYCRHKPDGAGAIPAPILKRLAALALYGDPACRLVLSWLDRRRTGASVPDQAAKATTESSKPSVSGARKTPRDRIVERLGAAPPEAVRPRGRKRPRWPVAVEAKSVVGPEIISATEETSHG